MATIFEIADRYDIGRKKLRRMLKAGILNCEPDIPPDNSLLAQMLRYARSRGGFTTPHLVALIEDASLLDHLGGHADKARKQLALLGDCVEPAPIEVHAEIYFSAMGELDSVARIVDWCKKTLPADRAVTHHYLAVRLLLGVPKHIRHFDEPRMQRVMLNCRKHEQFAGWWRIEKTHSRNVTYYQNPKLAFDL